MPNRLAEATSPYLLQHADNPVDWWEWGPSAFAEAEDRDVPVLLSVGYASCHWCHVMAHESFEDPETAAVMNRGFVNVKVDREERPDVDRIYMDAVQAMSGHGGWPMTVFLTPTGEPFFAGTYFPKAERPGHPSFGSVLEAVQHAWEHRRDDVESQAASLTASVAVTPPAGSELPGDADLRRAYEAIRSAFDSTNGGFGGAPKFPQAPTLEFLLRIAGREWASDAGSMLAVTLSKMADGGIRDHVAGGFARYSVDERWLVPHFEKMLYDNALLARLYARAWQVTGVEQFADVARSTIEYMLRDLALPDGGFASGEDADSEGEEGTYYVYSWSEFLEIGGSQPVAEVLGISPEGNFEGRSIVHRARSVADVASDDQLDPEALQFDVAGVVEGLRRLRETRVRPGLDDKAISAWNGLAIRALAEAGIVFEDERYLKAATTAARFILTHLRREDGRLLRSWRHGRASGPGFADDYGAVAVGFFALYQATGDPVWFEAGRELTEEMVELFWDESGGGFFATGTDAEQLIARPKNLFDNPTPSDSSLGAEALQHLAAYTGDAAHLDRLESTVRSASALIDRYPLGAGHMLAVLAVHATPAVELAVVGTDPKRSEMLRVVQSAYRPEVFVAVGDGEGDHGVPLLVDRPPVETVAAYVCRGFVCDAPVTTSVDLLASLGPGVSSRGWSGSG